MQRLWAPWRKAYIRPKKARRGCVFCQILKEKKDRANLILKRSQYCFAVLNLYPYNNGHVLILPTRHIKDISQLTPDEKLDWLQLASQVQAAMKKTMKAQGFNMGINLGATSGAGIPGHLHLHIVPRWIGDANFMPVIGQTKVISESLESVYQSLSKELSRGGKQ